MKALMIISFLTVQLFSSSNTAVDTISTALRTGDSKQISEYFGTSVDVTILDFHGFVDKATTTKKVNEFFSDKAVDGYKVIHSGKSKGKESVYTIGQLKTDKGVYKVYMFISELKDSHIIQEIKIEM